LCLNILLYQYLSHLIFTVPYTVLEKRSIVIFTNTLLSGGAEKQALLLALNLKDEYNVILVIYYGDKVEDKYLDRISDEKIEVIYLQGAHLRKLNGLYKLLKANNVAIIFSYLLTTNLIGAVIGKLAGVPFRVGGIRNAQLDKKKVPFQRFINNHLSTHTIYNNYRGLTSLQQLGFDVKNAVVIPNCFDAVIKPIQRNQKDIVRLITVGRFVHQKGYFEALKAMKVLKEGGLSFKYIIVGFGELEEQIKNEVIQLQLSDYVEIVINPPDLNSYYEISDIYLCSSYFEGLSNTVMEALSFSLPVVATNVGDNDKLVVDFKNGFLVDQCKHELFIDPLKKLIHSSDLRNKMGLKGYEILKNNYSSLAFKKQYTAFISQCTNKLQPLTDFH
jgi:glycosyltransferase involved in cell wall biosynthesis